MFTTLTILVNWDNLLISTKNKEQNRTIGMSLVLQVFGRELKETNLYIDIKMALERQTNRRPTCSILNLSNLLGCLTKIQTKTSTSWARVNAWNSKLKILWGPWTSVTNFTTIHRVLIWRHFHPESQPSKTRDRDISAWVMEVQTCCDKSEFSI